MVQKNINSVRKEIMVQLIFFLGLFRAIIIFGIRGVDCPSHWLTLTGPCQWSNAAFELILWTVATILFVLGLFWDHDWIGYLQACKLNWPVLGFVCLAALSLIWSINFAITLFRLIVLLSSSLMAIYIGHTYSLEKILKSLLWFYLVVCIFSLVFVIFLPQYGIMSDPFYKGAWNGIFWHRNYLGCFMALGITLFLVNLLSIKKLLNGDFLINLGMLIISFLLLLKSKSATGYILALILVSLVFVLFVWVKWHHKFRPVHYYGFLGVAVVAATLVLTNLEFLFGLLGRSASLTGRVPMWGYLFQHLINQRPWLGYGYGAIWHLQGIRDELAQIFNWGAQVMIGDNGFIDILLHLGIVGLAVLLTLIILGFIRAIKYFLHKRTLQAAFPIFVLVFVLVANISLSLILESETLVWIIALATLTSISNHFPFNAFLPLNGFSSTDENL